VLVRDFEEHGVRGRVSIRRRAPSGPGLEVVVLDPGSGRLRFVIGVRSFSHRPPPAWDHATPTLTLTPQGESELRSALVPRMAQWSRLLRHAERLDELCAAQRRLHDELRIARRPLVEARRALRAALLEGRIPQREYQAALRAAKKQAVEGPLYATSLEHRFEALLEEALGAPVQAEVFEAFVRARRDPRDPAVADALGVRVPGARDP
jgi:hypothetical protein